MLFFAGPLIARAQIGVGDSFPRLDHFGLTEGPLPDIGGRVVLVDFWASWCAPCKASFPAFARLHTEYAAQGFVIVAVSVDEKPAAYSAFLKKWHPPFVVVRDSEQKLVNVVKVPTMPTSYLIDRTGKVRFVHRGFHRSTSETELRRNIEEILNERTQE